MELIGRYVRKLLFELSLAVQKQAGVFAERLKPLEQSELKVKKEQTIRSGPDMKPQSPLLHSGGPPPHWIELVRNNAPELLQPPQPYQKHPIPSRVFSFQSATRDFSEISVNVLKAGYRADNHGRSELNEKRPPCSDTAESGFTSNDIKGSITEEPARQITKDRLFGREKRPVSPDAKGEIATALQKSGAVDPVENHDNRVFRQAMIQNTEPCLTERRIRIRPQSIAQRHSNTGQQSIVPQASQRNVSDASPHNSPTEIKNHTVINGAYMRVEKDRDASAAKLSSLEDRDSERNIVGHAYRFGNDNESVPVPVSKHKKFSSAASGPIHAFETFGQHENEIYVKRTSSVELFGVQNQNNGKQRQERLRAQPWPNLTGDQDSMRANSPAAMEPWPTLPENPVTTTKLSLHQELPGRFEDDRREMDRLQRINAEQKGVSWNESHF